MKIIRLQAENIKKLSAVEITPEGEIVQITGKNGSGKSSVLDCIWWALAGQSNIQKQPIRKGENHARIKLDLGEMIVTRTFSEDSASTLSVHSADKMKYSSPQKVLDSMVSNIAFDPLEFTRMDAKAQFDVLKRIAKLSVDPEQLDWENKIDYDKRHSLNTQKKALDARIRAFPDFPADLPAQPLFSTAISQQLAAAHSKNASFDLEAARRSDSLTRATSNARKAEQLIADLEGRLVNAKADLKRFQDAIAEFSKPVEGEKVDTTALAAQLETINQTNAMIAQRKERDELTVEFRLLDKAADKLSEQMDARTEQKQKAIASAKMPVKGLSFGDGIVLYKGLPIDQASSAEQLRVSCAIGMAGNPKLRVMVIKDGSLLDADSLKLLAGMAKEQDWQIWMERVDMSGKVGIVMEDGHVKKSEQ